MMKNSYLKVFCFCTLILFLLSSCSNISESDVADNGSELETLDYDNNNIRKKNNSLDSLLLKYEKRFKRVSGKSGEGIIDTFSGSMEDGDYGKCLYTYTFNESGTYEVIYVHTKELEQGSTNLANQKENGTFLICLKDDLYFITLKKSNGDERTYRYLVSEQYLVLLVIDENGNYQIETDIIVQKNNSTDDELQTLSCYQRIGKSDGLIGKWQMNCGQEFSYVTVELVHYGNIYSNEPVTHKAYPEVYEIEFSKNGNFSITKILATYNSQEGYKEKRNTVEGVFGVIEIKEGIYQLGLVSSSHTNLLTIYKVSKNYLFCENELKSIIASFSITYESNVGTVPNTIFLEENTILSNDYLPVITCASYIFNGWYCNNKKVSANLIAITANIVLTAKWTKLITISYESQYGIAPNSILITPGTILDTEQLPILYDDDYTFLGWYYNNSKIEPGDYSVTTDIPLQARWELDEVYWSLINDEQEKYKFMIKELSGTWLLHGNDTNYKVSFSEKYKKIKNENNEVVTDLTHVYPGLNDGVYYFSNESDYLQGYLYYVNTSSVYNDSYKWETQTSYQIWKYSIEEHKLRLEKTNVITRTITSGNLAYTIEDIENYINTGIDNKYNNWEIQYFPYPYSTSYGNDLQNLYFIKQ